MKRKNIIIAAVVLVIVALAVAFYLFATSGVTESDLEGLPACDSPEASSSIGCVSN
jgi:hypothetical protein